MLNHPNPVATRSAVPFAVLRVPGALRLCAFMIPSQAAPCSQHGTLTSELYRVSNGVLSKVERRPELIHSDR